MADKGGAKAGAAGGEEGKEGEDKEPEKGCCDKYAECLVVTGKAVYSCCLAICTCIRECLAFIWYPCKERCCGCLDNCDKHYNQWKDEGFTDV